MSAFGFTRLAVHEKSNRPSAPTANVRLTGCIPLQRTRTRAMHGDPRWSMSEDQPVPRAPFMQNRTRWLTSSDAGRVPLMRCARNAPKVA